MLLYVLSLSFQSSLSFGLDVFLVLWANSTQSTDIFIRWDTPVQALDKEHKSYYI